MKPKMHLNTLLDTIILMLLDHYEQYYHKLQALQKKINENATMYFIIKNYNKIWEKVETLLKQTCL